MSEEHRPGPEWEAARFSVRYAETDAAGIVHHATYLVWFEEGRSELSRRLGLPYRQLEEAGVVLVVVEAELRYLSGAHYDEVVEVWTSMRRVRSRSCVFDYRVIAAADGRLLATGSTSHVAVDRETGRPTTIPEPFRSTYALAVPAADPEG